jgi:hypothetical protein
VYLHEKLHWLKIQKEIMPDLITIDWDSEDADFDQIYDLAIGDVFKFTKNIETINTKIQTRKPDTLLVFTAKIVTPGSGYWPMYGPNTFVVVNKVAAPAPPPEPPA